jgi:hypothetical protein
MLFIYMEKAIKMKIRINVNGACFPLVAADATNSDLLSTRELMAFSIPARAVLVISVFGTNKL